ncbi:uncharacterized protein LOC128250270 [Octopus bimaculoides]|uniref:uncharacterized protein LOC128250270 n=1 Tax=Octopus bimaculoides TaxID=37653 RepID=UPI0022DEC8B7|nr:uncharacterized protein LOC128250270 [Octopus bimaculoides]
MTPADGIDIGKTSKITMTCRYNVTDLLNFKLLRNEVTVAYLECSKSTNRFKTIVNKDGFDCTLAYCNEGEVTCWKRNPTCKDVAHYKCGTSSENSKTKFMKVRSRILSLGMISDKTFTIPWIIRCSAIVGLPSPPSVTFSWNIGTPDISIKVYKVRRVPPSRKCFVVVNADYYYIVRERDLDYTTFTCKIFGTEISRIINLD